MHHGSVGRPGGRVSDGDGVQRTREMLSRYLASGHEDLAVMADDVVFTTMGTGEEHHGREGVRRMLHHIYHLAFDAHAELRTLACEESHAVVEAVFVGRHTGEFAGVPATNRHVRVPLCVVYDLRDGLIHRGRVYFEVAVLLEQLGVTAGSADRPQPARQQQPNHA